MRPPWRELPVQTTWTTPNANTNLHNHLAPIQNPIPPPSFLPCPFLLPLQILPQNFSELTLSLGNLPPTFLSQMAEISAPLDLVTSYKEPGGAEISVDASLWGQEGGRDTKPELLGCSPGCEELGKASTVTVAPQEGLPVV